MTPLLSALLAALLLPTSLREALDKYDFGEFETACAQLEVLRHEPSFDVEARLKTLKFLGACRHVQGQLDAATEAFEALLDLDPRAKLDPVQFPPDMVRFFADVRARREASPPPPRPEVRPGPEPEPGSEPRSVGLALLPFGVGQAQNHQPTKAAWLGAAQGITLATGVVTLALFESEKESGGFLTGGSFEDTGKAETLHGIYVGSFATFGALWAYGVVDALVNLDEPAPVAVMPTSNGVVGLWRW